tara:strand:+ start:584 stop:880 length:297 start_codon:yes stop_codon:yes gene_type:complete
MKNNKVEIILKELLTKTKGVKKGLFAPEICEIPLKDIENYDFFIYDELQHIERELWSSKTSNTFLEKKKFATILKITDDDKVTFIPSIIKEYLKEIKK